MDKVDMDMDVNTLAVIVRYSALLCHRVVVSSASARGTSAIAFLGR